MKSNEIKIKSNQIQSKSRQIKFNQNQIKLNQIKHTKRRQKGTLFSVSRPLWQELHYRLREDMRRLRWRLQKIRTRALVPQPLDGQAEAELQPSEAELAKMGVKVAEENDVRTMRVNSGGMESAEGSKSIDDRSDGKYS